MKVLLLGVGIQGKAALYDLFNNLQVSTVVAADINQQAVSEYITAKGYGSKVVAESVDASDRQSLELLIMR